MIATSLSTAIPSPPAFVHASATAFARILNPSNSFADRTSLAIPVPDSIAPMSGATFLFHTYQRLDALLGWLYRTGLNTTPG